MGGLVVAAERAALWSGLGQACPRAEVSIFSSWEPVLIVLRDWKQKERVWPGGSEVVICGHTDVSEHSVLPSGQGAHRAGASYFGPFDFWHWARHFGPVWSVLHQPVGPLGLALLLCR